MDEKNIQFASQIIKPSYATLGLNSIQKRTKIVKQLLTQRKLPDQPLDQLTIQFIMDELALMDSNNFYQKVGVGQRQSRIFSPLVQRRNFFMGHGIGRSGDIMANQPKAAGSSLLLQLTRFLTISALKQLNYEFVKDVLLLPMATGMALTLAFLTLAENYPEKRYLIWSRIDQKTCLKSIKTANLIPIVIQQKIIEDTITCDHQAIQEKINEIGQDKILCIVSTTSCFAPRVPDNVLKNSNLAKKYGLFHIVNNAYGLWCTKIANNIKQSFQNGQCTIVVQSTDKNFLVPVGGSIIFTQKQSTLQKISGKYPGRACGSPIIDLFLTFLSMGKKTINFLKKQRKQNYQYMIKRAQKFAQKNQCKLLKTPGNTISIGMNIQGLKLKEPVELGAILYTNKVMGHRILNKTEKITKIAGIQFKNYGSHHDNYPYLPYINFACAVGTQKNDIDEFFKRLQSGIKELRKKQNKKIKKEQQKQQKIQKIQQVILVKEQTQKQQKCKQQKQEQK